MSEYNTLDDVAFRRGEVDKLLAHCSSVRRYLNDAAPLSTTDQRILKAVAVKQTELMEESRILAKEYRGLLADASGWGASGPAFGAFTLARSTGGVYLSDNGALVSILDLRDLLQSIESGGDTTLHGVQVHDNAGTVREVLGVLENYWKQQEPLAVSVTVEEAVKFVESARKHLTGCSAEAEEVFKRWKNLNRKFTAQESVRFILSDVDAADSQLADIPTSADLREAEEETEAADARERDAVQGIRNAIKILNLATVANDK